MNRAIPRTLVWKDVPLLSIDLETTGFGRSDSIIEFACVLDWKGKIVDEYSTLIRSVDTVPKKITEITRITTEQISTAPLWEDVESEILDVLLCGAPWVAHSAAFDFRFLRNQLSEWPTGIPTLCTLTAARKISPYLESHSLKSLCEVHEIELNNAHQALEDARATAILARKLVNTFSVTEHATKSSEDWKA